MEIVKQTVTIPRNRQLSITLPESAAPDSSAEVIIRFPSVSGNGDKIALMESAMSDPLFVADIEEIAADFNYADLDEVAR